MKIHGSPSDLDAKMTELEGSLQDAKKWYKVAFDFVKEKTRQVEEHRKTSLQETESHVKALKKFQDEVSGLKQDIHDSL